MWGGEFAENARKTAWIVAVAALTGLAAGCGSPPEHAAQPVAATQPAEVAGMPHADTGAKDHLDAAHHPDWMSALPDAAPLSTLSLPGTHDTLSIHGGKAGPAVLTQERFDAGCAPPDLRCPSVQTLNTQLESGIRALDIRVRRDEAGNLAVQHGDFYQQANFDDVLRVSSEFLTRHPRETILMRVKAECTNDGAPFRCADAGGLPPDSALVDRYLDAQSRVWRPAAAGPVPIPRLGEVRGAIVVMCADGVDKRGLPLEVQDLWDGPSREVKWAAVAAHLDRVPANDGRALSVNYLSASGVPDPRKFPGRYADYENQHALDRLRSKPAAVTGVLMMDFPGPALVGEIIGHNPH